MKGSGTVEFPLVLVCAPSGTGLSRVGEWLDKQIESLSSPALVFDLELELRARRYEDQQGAANIKPNTPDSLRAHQSALRAQAKKFERMDQVLRDSRARLLEQWVQTYDNIMSRVAGEWATTSPSFVALFLHLTWYDPQTRELFSPVNIPILSTHGEVRRVILLIDDIFDMFSSLRGGGREDQDRYALYSDRNLDSEAGILGKLWTEPAEPSRANERAREHYRTAMALCKRHRSVEAVEAALTQLLSWRRYEMIQAESIARTLGADFTLLGTKHSRSALRLLASGSKAHEIYLSHRISEVRRSNKTDEENKSEWPLLVDEVNSLHGQFAEEGCLLINPTAIDELRFGAASTGGPGPILTPRWPLPGGSLLWATPDRGNSPDHTELLSGELDPSDQIALGSARSLAKQILSEVAARDHMIVEHTPGICVYRPFFASDRAQQATSSTSPDSTTKDRAKDAEFQCPERPKTRWSGGVRRELEHWLALATLPDLPQRRAAFVHTDKEITLRLQWLREASGLMPEAISTVHNHLDNNLFKVGIPKALRRIFFKGQTTYPADFFGARDDERLLDHASQIVKWMRSCTAISLFETFTRLDRPDDDKTDSLPKFAIGLFYAEENEEGGVKDLRRLSTELCSFFRSSDSHEEGNRKFWSSHDRIFGDVFQMDPPRFFAKELNIAYEDFVRADRSHTVQD